MRRVREIILAVLLAVIGVGMAGMIRSDAADDNPTRAEWIHDLVTVFQMEVEEDNYPDNYYSDLQITDSCYSDVMTATEFGLVDLDAGQAFDPDGAVTREFAAHTLNSCLGFQIEQNGNYTYTDVEAVVENARNDAQIALNRKWLALIDGKFEPNRAVTAAESTAMLADAKNWTGALEVDDSKQNKFTYKEGVVEIPEVTSVEKTEAGAIIIYDTSVSLNKNDVFVIYSDGLPQAYKADTVTSENDKVVVMATEQDINDVIQTADAQGVVDGDISQIQPAEGVTVQYTEEYQDEESTSEKAGEMGRASGTKKVKKATFTAKVGGSCKVKITLSGMKIKYKVNSIDDVSVVLSGDATIHATGSFNNGGMSTIPLGSLNIGGVANVRLDANVLVSGRIEADYVTGFSVGAQKKPYDDWRLVKEFKKKRFTICSEISMSTGLNASAKLTGIPLVSGDMSAEMGVTTDVTNITRPSGTPHTCTHVLTYIYARAGAALTVGEGIVSKTFSKSVVVYDKKNSPVRTAYHYEDGVWKMPCSVDPDNFYYTKGDSRYGLNSSGYGMDDEGQPYQIFEYSLDDDGNATITKYHGNVYHVAVPEEIDGYKVVAIGDGAFKSNNSFSSVAIPNPIKKIGGSAFNKCTALTSVSLPKEFEVSGGVFSGCSSLSDVSFEDGIKTIPENLFYNTGLVQIEIPETVTEIGGNAFAKCVNLRKVILHEGLEKIGGDTFSGCEKLNDITLPLSMKTLGGNAFESCTSLKKINIPKNMGLSGVLRPYMAPFYKCSSLCEIEFEPGITSIPDGLFAGCNGLATVEIPDTVTGIYGSTWNCCGAFMESSISEVILPESIEIIGEHAFSSCNNLTEVKLPNSLKELCDNAFADCKALSSVSFPKDFDVTGVIGGAYRGPFDGCSSLSEVTFGEGIEKIPVCLFQGSGITKTQIPDTVKEIAGGVFQDCTALKEAVIPDTVTVLGGGVFSGCTGLESVKYSKGLTEIPDTSFKNCTALGQIELHDKITVIGKKVFENCISLKEITLPPHLEKLGEATFMGCQELAKISIPNTVTSINRETFSGCEKLEEAVLGAGLTQIGTNAFMNCKMLKGIRIPDTVNTLGQKVFYGCESLSELSLGAGIKEIPAGVFSGTALQEAVLPWQVTSVGKSAFANCVNLRDVTVNRLVSSIAADTFSYKNKLTIHGVAGTYAETYAKENEIAFEAMDVAATKIVLSESKCEMALDSSKKLTLQVTPENATDEVSWRSLDEAVATVDGFGNVNAKGIGEAKIIVAVGSQTAECEVSVYKPVKRVSLDHTAAELRVGETLQLAAEVTPSDAKYKEVLWLSDAESVAAVNAQGVVTAKAAGTATVTATSKDGGKTATCKITVVEGSPAPSGTPQLKGDSSLTYTEDGTLTGLIQGQNTVREIAQAFTLQNLVFKDMSGAVLAEDAALGTGATVSVMDGDTVKASCQVVLAGDVTGDGKVNGKDVSMTARSLVGKATLNDAQKSAADVQEDGAVNGKDVSKLARSLVGKSTIASQAQ